MGLYDDIRCDLPLPEGTGRWFQTKDTDCEMKKYFIRADGRLIKNEYDIEDTPPAELPHAAELATMAPDDPMRPLFELSGCIRAVAGSQREVDTEMDGDVYFGDYRATFRRGNCREISRWTDGAWSLVWPEASTT